MFFRMLCRLKELQSFTKTENLFLKNANIYVCNRSLTWSPIYVEMRKKRSTVWYGLDCRQDGLSILQCHLGPPWEEYAAYNPQFLCPRDIHVYEFIPPNQYRYRRWCFVLVVGMLFAATWQKTDDIIAKTGFCCVQANTRSSIWFPCVFILEPE